LRRTLFSSPYRCCDCDDLFWVTRKIFNPAIIRIGAIGLIAVTIGGAFLWLGKKEFTIKDGPAIVFDLGNIDYTAQSQEKTEDIQGAPKPNFEYSWETHARSPTVKGKE